MIVDPFVGGLIFLVSGALCTVCSQLIDESKPAPIYYGKWRGFSGKEVKWRMLFGGLAFMGIGLVILVYTLIAGQGK